jgi:hypothetical protein
MSIYISISISISTTIAKKIRRDLLHRPAWTPFSLTLLEAMRLFIAVFFFGHFARFVWRAIHIVFGIIPPKNIGDLFNQWMIGLGV